VALVLGAPALAQQLPTNACGSADDAAAAIAKEGYEVIAYFERYAGKAEDGTDKYLATYISAAPSGNGWYLFKADKPKAEIKSAQLCVKEKGQRLEILDHKTYKEGFQNEVELTIDGKKEVFKQGVIYFISRKEGRKAVQELEATGGQSDKQDVFYTDVMGYRFDYRNAEAACVKARKRWGQELTCRPYEDQVFNHADYADMFVVLEALSKGASDDESYILSVLVKTDTPEADVTLLYTTLDGGSMKLQTGRKFEFRGWAAGK
jgi:hypothetical protein